MSCAPSHDVAAWGITGHKAFGPFSIRRFSQPPRRELPWHRHDQASICYVVTGSYAEITRARETACPTQAMVFKPAAEPHANRFGERGATCLLIEIDAPRLDAIERCTDLMARPRMAQRGRLAALGLGVTREFAQADPCSALAVEGLILEILAEASRAAVTERGGGDPVWLRRARELLHDRFREPLALSSVARAVGVHPSHLARTFGARYHTTLGEYVRRLRIECASRELAETEMPLGEIALGLGFFDQSHFCRVYKRYTGLSASEVRRGVREKSG